MDKGISREQRQIDGRKRGLGKNVRRGERETREREMRRQMDIGIDRQTEVDGFVDGQIDRS